MTKLQSVKLGAVDPNPFRRVEVYPYVEKKLDTLLRSYADVGMWEGVIGRKVGNRIEIAFGHHRVEAARRAEISEIPIIIRELDDEQMLKFMGRENGEDYNADFLCMLETWEAAKNYLSGDKKQQAIDIARLLGWTRLHPNGKNEVVTKTAEACAAASKLIEDGSFERADFEDLNVSAARDIAAKVVSTKKQIEKVSKKFGGDKKKATEMKKAADKGGKKALKDVRSGDKVAKDAKHEVDTEVRKTKAFKKTPPMIDVMLDGMVTSIDRMLNEDATGKKLEEVSETLRLPDLELNSTAHHSLKQTREAMNNLEGRARGYQKELTTRKAIKAVSGDRMAKMAQIDAKMEATND